MSDIKEEEIMEAGENPDGSECLCICHRVAGVRHAIACCWADRQKLNQILGQLTKEDYEKLKGDK